MHSWKSSPQNALAVVMKKNINYLQKKATTFEGMNVMEGRLGKYRICFLVFHRGFAVVLLINMVMDSVSDQIVLDNNEL